MNSAIVFIGLRGKRLPRPLCNRIILMVHPEIYFKYACRAGIEWIFNFLADYVNLPEMFEWTCDYGFFKLFWLFVARGEAPVGKNKKNMSKAIDHGFLEGVKYFHETDEKLINIIGQFSFRHACSGGHVEIVKYLVSQNVDSSSVEYQIQMAICRDDINMFKYLLEIKQPDNKNYLDYQWLSDQKGAKKINEYLWSL